jgi:hypothetical protein
MSNKLENVETAILDLLAEKDVSMPDLVEELGKKGHLVTGPWSCLGSTVCSRD